MPFPLNPIAGSTTVTNNITYTYAVGTNGVGYWTRTPVYITTSSSSSGGTAASGTGTTTTFVIQNFTQSTGTNSGALQVYGGAGIGGNLYVGGTIYQNGVAVGTGGGGTGGSSTGTTTTFTISNLTPTTSTTTGALVVAGGVGIGQNLNVGGVISGGGVRTSTTSTTPTGAQPGDIWYNTAQDVTYRYTYDGANYNWVDITGPIAALSTNTVLIKNAYQGYILVFGG